MELQQLRYFHIVAELENVNRAAERLVISPSAVSRAVKRLEAEIGVDLFTREGRVIRLNRFGREFARRSREATSLLARSVDGVRELAAIQTGQVNLGFLTSLGSEIVPALISRHRVDHPQVHFELHQESGRELIGQLRRGSIDLLLSVPGLFDDVGIDWHPLFDQPLLVSLPPGHRLARRARIALDELRDESFVALTTDYTVRHFFDTACTAAGFVPRIVFEGTDLSTLRGLITAGVAVGILPAASEDIQPVQVALDDGLARTIALGTIDSRYLPPSADEFRRVVIGAAAAQT